MTRSLADRRLDSALSGELYSHSRGSVVTSFENEPSDCYDDQRIFTGRRTAEMPVLLKPFTTVCVNLYRHALEGQQPPVQTARNCVQLD